MLEPVLTVVVTTEAVVLAWQPDQVVHWASVLQGPSVQPLHVDAGHALPPHQLVQGPWVQAPEARVDQAPQPLPAPPKGPAPLPPCQPPGPRPLRSSEELPSDPPVPQTPKGAGAPVVWVFQLERAEAYAELEVQAVGQAEPPRGNISLWFGSDGVRKVVMIVMAEEKLAAARQTTTQ